MDLVVTVCASAADEVCPVWPGAPLRMHWEIDDPANAPADQIDLACQVAYRRLSAHINAFLALEFEDMTTDELRRHLKAVEEM